MNVKKPPIRIVFFGDSICVGQGISVHSGWVTRIAAHAEELGKMMDRDILVVNSSVNGNTTRQALERMPYDVQSHNIDMMIVQFGMNDCNYWQTDKGNPRVSLKAFGANLEEIIARAKSFGAKKILINTNHLSTRTTHTMPHTDLTYEQSNQQYNTLIRELAHEQGEDIILIDMAQIFIDYIRTKNMDTADFVLEDGLHLNLKGHDLYFNAIYPKLETQLKIIASIKEYL